MSKESRKAIRKANKKSLAAPKSGNKLKLIGRYADGMTVHEESRGRMVVSGLDWTKNL
jgi:hypothetical protein